MFFTSDRIVRGVMTGQYDKPDWEPLLELAPEAMPLDGYVVHLRFEDGLAADIGLSYLLDFGGVFEPLRDLEFFRKMAIDDGGDTIAWPNESDIAPETLYDHVQRADYERRRAEGLARV